MQVTVVLYMLSMVREDLTRLRFEHLRLETVVNHDGLRAFVGPVSRDRPQGQCQSM
jgi:hypothetical protein